MGKLPSLEHVKYVKRRGKVYAYFNTGAKKDGKPIYKRLPDPASPEFYTQYSNLKTRRGNIAAKGFTVADLVDEYLKSSDYASKAQATQTLYRVQSRKIIDAWGKFPVNDLAPEFVRLVLDGSGWGSGTHNMVIATLGTIYTWARKRNKAAIEPTKDIETMKGKAHEPWPEDVLEAALASDDPVVRLGTHLLYFTGQRLNDVLAMRWGDIRGDEIHVVPEKTKRYDKRVYVRIHAELAAELARTPRLGITIMHGMDDRRLRIALQAFTQALGIKTVPHGLRKNAVNALLEAGCTIAEVAAITGQTFKIVEHYAARVNNRKLGQAAMLKFENKRKIIPKGA